MFIAAVAVVCSAAAETILCAEREGEKLYFDHYPAVGVEGKAPCVIFAFGGALSTAVAGMIL